MQEDIIYIKPEKPVPSFLSFQKKENLGLLNY